MPCCAGYTKVRVDVSYMLIYIEIMNEVALRKVGTSFVATIPAELVQQLKLVQGQKLKVGKENGRIILTPVTAHMEAVARAYARVAKRYRSALQKLADV